MEAISAPTAQTQPDDPAIDRQLMAKIQSGDQTALATLYDRQAPQMMGLAMRILQNRRDAEDLLHDVFLEAWQKADAYQADRGTVRNWLLLRTRSRAIDRLRALKTAREKGVLCAITEEETICDEHDPSTTADNILARKALDSLSKIQRIVIELSYFEGLTCSEIATHCNIPIGTVKSRLSAAMTKLRDQLSATEREANV